MHYTVFIDLYYLIILKFHKLEKDILQGNLGYEAINKTCNTLNNNMTITCILISMCQLHV